MTTPFGRITRRDYGDYTIRGSVRELYDWAHRPGHHWPCSTLCHARRITATFDADGNLIDIDHPGTDDVDAHELAAWADDVRTWEADVLATCTTPPA